MATLTLTINPLGGKLPRHHTRHVTNTDKPPPNDPQPERHWRSPRNADPASTSNLPACDASPRPWCVYTYTPRRLPFHISHITPIIIIYACHCHWTYWAAYLFRPYLEPPIACVVLCFPLWLLLFRYRLPCTAPGRRCLGPVICCLGQNRFSPPPRGFIPGRSLHNNVDTLDTFNCRNTLRTIRGGDGYALWESS